MHVVCDKFHHRHTYLPIYEKLFESRQSAKNVLEVGVFDGNSIMLWHDFFQQANIYGLDTRDMPPFLSLLSRVVLTHGDAYTTQVVDLLRQDAEKRSGCGAFDVLIDDGPHTIDSMKFFAENYTGLLAQDGVLIIEDVQSPSWIPEIIDAFPEAVRGKVGSYDLRQANPAVWDDILIVLDMNR